MRAPENVLVTGGAGFIGCNFIRTLLSSADFSGRIVNVDSLTYAGNLESLADLDQQHGGTRYLFEHEDIRDQQAMERLLRTHAVDAIVHFAAESHVDRSIHGPADFIHTNVNGTFSLLEAARAVWGDRRDVLFHHVSTDEVYGSLGDTGLFTEESPYDPRSPYSASKAASDHLVRAYYHTYGLPVTLSNCSNNYGPYQFPEKLVPLMILNMVAGEPLPVYGDGRNVRDWLFVTDHATAIWLVVQQGRTGETYNIGGENEWENIRLVNTLCEKVATELGHESDRYKSLITFVKDRPGHDRRYAIDCAKIKEELQWQPSVTFETGLQQTVRWYLDNAKWIENVRSGEYRKWLDTNYGSR